MKRNKNGAVALSN